MDLTELLFEGGPSFWLTRLRVRTFWCRSCGLDSRSSISNC